MKRGATRRRRSAYASGCQIKTTRPDDVLMRLGRAAKTAEDEGDGSVLAGVLRVRVRVRVGGGRRAGPRPEPRTHRRGDQPLSSRARTVPSGCLPPGAMPTRRRLISRSASHGSNDDRDLVVLGSQVRLLSQAREPRTRRGPAVPRQGVVARRGAVFLRRVTRRSARTASISARSAR